MAQTVLANSRSGAAASVYLSVNAGGAWTNVSGNGATVTVSGGDHVVGSQHTFDGRAPVVTPSNKTQSVTVTVSGLWENTASAWFDLVWDVIEAGTFTCAVRWAPLGGTDTVVGNPSFQTTSDAGVVQGYVVGFQPPDMDASSGDPLMWTLSVECAKVTRTLTTTA